MTKKKTTSSKVELEKSLDAALQDTFPASDPVQVGSASSVTADRPVGRRPARIDKALVERLAAEVADKQGAA